MTSHAKVNVLWNNLNIQIRSIHSNLQGPHLVDGFIQSDFQERALQSAKVFKIKQHESLSASVPVEKESNSKNINKIN